VVGLTLIAGSLSSLSKAVGPQCVCVCDIVATNIDYGIKTLKHVFTR